MCVFIVVAVAKGPADTAEQFTRRGLYVREPATVEGVNFAADAARLYVSDGHCACSVYAGDFEDPAEVQDTNQSSAEESQRQRYRRKGWSEAKIDRAITARREAAQKTPQARADLSGAFASAVAEIVGSGAKVALVASDYDAKFEVSGSIQLPLQAFVVSGGRFPQNTVVNIRR